MKHDWQPAGPGVERCASPGCPWHRVDIRRGQGFVLDPLSATETLKLAEPSCGPLKRCTCGAATCPCGSGRHYAQIPEGFGCSCCRYAQRLGQGRAGVA